MHWLVWMSAILVVACESSSRSPKVANRGIPSAAGDEARSPGGAGFGENAAVVRGMQGAVSYKTAFDLAESPISERGAWTHRGLDWTFVDTSGGNAYGTQALSPRSGTAVYNDSYAYLSGFTADQTAAGVVHLDGKIDRSCYHEVEVLLRWQDAAHTARGYECNLAYDGAYTEIVRWNGSVGDFTYLARGSVPGGVHDGDTMSASIAGSTITVSVNGTVRLSARDSTYATGNPGIGFYRSESGCGTFGDYGFTQFTATSP